MAIVLGAITLLTTYLPARRASRVHPIVALGQTSNRRMSGLVFPRTARSTVTSVSSHEKTPASRIFGSGKIRFAASPLALVVAPT